MSTKNIKLPPLLIEFGKIFTTAGYKAYLVGGAVRDMFMKVPAHDWDVATNATPQDVIKLFKFVVPTGIEHGTVTVHFKGTEIEVTTFRTEAGYSDGRHPDSINYAATIEEDLARRDFTMNAIAASLEDGAVVDPYGGQEDIKNRLIKTVGVAHERFMEDGLRPVRALRFASKLNFSIENNTYSEIFKKEIQEKAASISIERFRDEFEKIMASPKPSVGLKLLEETGLMSIFLPEFMVCRGCVQSDYRAFHKFDVMDHLYYACDGAPADKLNVRLAALFHDIGKPAAKKLVKETVLDGDKNDGSTKEIETITFYNHESYSEIITKQVMTRLKFSNEMINNVCHLVKEHMFHYETNWSEAAVRRFIIRTKPECMEDLYDLRMADMYGMYNEPVDIRYSASIQLLLELKERVHSELEKKTTLSLKSLAVNGRDLMAAGIPAGKELGRILNELLECVIEDPEMNDKDRLLEVAKRLSN
ncbi:tRNA nucleotidyltransferase (CCA-adding enzyme) [Treponema bryantii]|uniref:tRNA nucleotidyltransferase (CCA-adding enzyme) n=1 Tax=Treponema bryantii TaxID=163 RepID=A0A1H9AMY4_9SPIR|nr:HD domain-containing protein [Treponema bryantii]SEP77911.1 tRNA nucleotidyltransferase (CCA-adding enzyme) [Treponema bryantii]